MAGTAGAGSRGSNATPILVAMVLGALVGWFLGPAGTVGGFDLLPLFEFLGTIFINMLKMVGRAVDRGIDHYRRRGSRIRPGPRPARHQNAGVLHSDDAPGGPHRPDDRETSCSRGS